MWVFCACFAPIITVPVDFIFGCIDRNVYKVPIFRGCNVEYYAVMRKYEQKYSSSGHLSLCGHNQSVQKLSRVYILNTSCIHWEYISVSTVNRIL